MYVRAIKDFCCTMFVCIFINHPLHLEKKVPKTLIVKIEEIPSEENRYLILHVYVHILEIFYLEMYSLMILKRKLIYKYHKKA